MANALFCRKESKYFNNVENLLNILPSYLENIEERNITMEKKIDGKLLTLSKIKNEINISGFDEAIKLKHIKDEVGYLSDSDFIVNGTLCEESIFLSDILKFGNENLENQEWKVRRNFLHSLFFTSHIKENFSMVFKDVRLSSTKENIAKGIETFKLLKYYNGCIIRPLNSKYEDVLIEIKC